MSNKRKYIYKSLTNITEDIQKFLESNEKYIICMTGGILTIKGYPLKNIQDIKDL